MSEITVPEVTVLNVEHSARDCGKIMCTVQICASTGQTRDIQLMVDTGSAVSILPMSVYTGSFSQAPLSQPKLSLVSFGGDPIEVKGCLPASISYGGHCTTTHLYIVQNGSAVLGRDLFTGLSLQLRDGQYRSVHTYCLIYRCKVGKQAGMCKRIYASCSPSVWCSACAAETEAVTFLNSQRGVHGIAEAC